MANQSSGTRRFGKYRLLKKVGSGGMAEVYKAEHAKDPGSPVAIKRILADLSRDKKLVSMLINEAKLAMMLTHPNIVTIYDFGLVDKNYFLAMEYVEGKDLRTFLKKAYSEDKIIPLEISVYIMINVLEGLAYAHSKRDNFNKPLEIIHRDISPQNIIISYDGNVKILDFGIAKAKGSLTETQAGILKGKFSYMSPEQAKGKNLDQRSDIFSAGIVFHELLTTRSLFGDQSEIKIIQKVRKAKVDNPTDINPKVPSGLAKIVLKSLSKWRFRRFRTAEEYRDELVRWSEKSGLVFSKELLKDYINSEFPFGEEDRNIPQVRQGSSLTDREPMMLEFLPDAGSNIGNLIEEELKKDTDTETDPVKETVIEHPVRSESYHPSFPSYQPIQKKKIALSSILTARVLFLSCCLLLAIVMYSMKDKIRIGRNSIDKIYRYAVLLPAEEISKLLPKSGAGQKSSPILDTELVFKTAGQIYWSKNSQLYANSLPYERFDSLMKDIRNHLLSGEPTSDQKCTSIVKDTLCAQFEDIRITYQRELPEGNIRISKIENTKRK